ncbi:MAG: hypothetical protein HUJ26_13310 [Planctomycetaceae bacterium]|nr:hypothetical protein [Planctomycetaceae bacterium]
MLQSLTLRARRLVSFVSPQKICSLVAGSGLTLAAMSWLALYGLGLSVTLASLLAGCGGISLALLATRSRFSAGIPSWARWLAVTTWLGLMPVWISISNLSPVWLTTSQLESITLQVVGLLPAAICMIGLPGMLIVFAVTKRSTAGTFGDCWALFAGSLLTLFLDNTVLASTTLLWADVVILMCAAGWELTTVEAATNSSRMSFRNARRHSLAESIWILLLPALMVGLWSTMAIVIRPWALVTTPLLSGQLLILSFATLFSYGISGTQRMGTRLRHLPPAVWLLLPFLLSMLLILRENSVTHWMMELSAEWPTPFWQQTARLTILGSYPFLIGCSVGLWLRKVRPISSSASSLWWGAFWLAAFSFAATRILLHTGVSASRLLLGLGILSVFASGFQFFVPSRSVFEARRRRQILTAALSLCVVYGAIQLPAQTGQIPSKLLFHAAAWAQFRSGVSWDSLPFIDDGREIESLSSEEGLYTAYNYRGLETSIRRNGIPQGYVSLDYRVMPQFPTDVLMAVLPSVMHGHASQVAVCRWGCGVTVSSSLDFPIESIDCFDADPDLVDITYGREVKNPWAGLNPVTDSRVSLYDVRPELALRADGAEYDLIISSPMRSASVESVSEMTAEFYQSAARRLAAEGLFCQRFQHYDHGPSAWADVLATLQNVFPHVVAIEMLPGETLFIAGRSDNLLRNEDLPARLQKPQIRRVLARFGWDWGHVLNLPTVTAEKTGDLLSIVSADVQSIQSPVMFQKHNRDAMRWANKWEEKTEAFAPYRSRLLSLAGDEGQSAEVKRRLEEVDVQQKQMAELVDFPWAYRAQLKQFLSTKPRSELRQVKGEKPQQEMHPIDKRRVEYLEALSDAHQTKPASAELISELDDFATPYDPLVSYFLHHEAAELYARSPGLDPHAELYHRLKTIYFGDVRDKSVRNVIGALNLILERESLISDDQDRFDQLHGLLQFLLNRWQLRRGYSPRNSDEGLTDVRESLKVAERTLRELDRLASVTAYGEEAWQNRRDYLELHLVKPLRAYRGHLIPHHQSKTLSAAGPEEE